MGFVETLKIFYHYARPYRGRLLLGILALFGVDALHVIPPLLLKSFIDQAASAPKSFMPFLLLGLAYLAVALVQGVFRYLWRVLLVKASYQAATDLRHDYFAKLQRLPPAFYDQHPIGDLMALATNDVESVRFALGPGLLVFADAAFLFITLPPAMIYLSPKFTFLSLAPLLAVPFLIAYSEKIIHTRFQKVQEQFSKLSAFAQENIEGIQIIKAFLREWTQLQRFSRLGKEFVRLNLKLVKAQALFEPLFLLFVSFGLASLLAFGGRDVITGRASLGTFVAFTRYLDHLVWPMMAFGLAVTYYQRGKSSMKRLLEVLRQPELAENPYDGLVHPGVYNSKKTEAPLLEVRGLTFTYPGRTLPTLKNISFTLDEHSRSVLVGPVGAGKSTLVKLLSGLYEVPRGTIFWKGRDITDVPLRERRRKLSVVPQDVFLFSESLEWNLSLGLDGRAERDTLEKALRKAGLSQEMTGWDLGMHIGERGCNLSGGQRARITLARALAKREGLLILDDALSNVDAETEQQILKGLEDRDGSLSTLLMITHRLARLEHFNQVLVLWNGELVQNGPATVLQESPGIYRDLFELQRMDNAMA